jgi:N-acetyl-alpha-D-glucosaminyl L-malate synthase BshA
LGRRIEFAQPDERLLVHLSNFRPVKRVTDVVEIFDRVQKKIPARLMMIGDGPDRRAAERLACSRGIHDKIHFLGKQDMIHEKLALADVMLLPSEMESFGLAALEAMACEVVPVASRVGGLPEVVEDRKDGFLAPAGDVDAMAACALEVLTDDALLATMRKAARATAQARFCTTKIIPQYEELYRGLLERKS